MTTIRFLLPDGPDGPPDRPPAGAYVLGPDDLPLPGEVAVRDGALVCRGPGIGSLALALPWEVGRFGRLVEQTCLLPERDEPYRLVLELARCRIKAFLAKCEEWQMLDLDRESPAMQAWEAARGHLTRALIAADPGECDRAAATALELATAAAERLAIRHAEILLHRRFRNRPASSSTLGVVVSPRRESDALRDLVGANFDLVVLPVRWRDLEVREGSYNWGPLDRWMEWARGAKRPIVAGPLVDLSPGAVPDWVMVWQNDYDTLRDMVYDHVERVVARYRGVVGMWNLAAGLERNDGLRLDAGQMVDLVRTARLLVRQHNRAARTMIEIRAPFGEDAALRSDALAPLAFIERLVQGGVQFDAIGVQVLAGGSRVGARDRDLLQLSHVLDRFAHLETPIVVSALGAPGVGEEAAAAAVEAGVSPAWTHERQSKWLSRLFPIALSKPFVESIFWCDLYDHEQAAVPFAGLIDAQGRPKPALSRLVGMRRRLRRPLGATGDVDVDAASVEEDG